MSVKYHIAQINIARMRAPLDDPVMAGFAAQLAPMNQLADESPGFVWRLETDEGDATAVRPYEDELIIPNMTVWESIEALHDFVYRRPHRHPLRDRRSWFLPLDGPNFVLWWVEAGHNPTVEEGTSRLEMLAENGPTPEAFTFARPFPPPGVKPFTDADMDRLAETCEA